MVTSVSLSLCHAGPYSFTWRLLEVSSPRGPHLRSAKQCITRCLVKYACEKTPGELKSAGIASEALCRQVVKLMILCRLLASPTPLRV